MTEKRPLRQRLRRRFPTPGHYLLFARIFLASLAQPFLLRFLSLPALMRALTPARQPGPVDEAAMQEAELIDLYIRVILRLNPENIGRMCLKRSLLLFRFLRDRGIPARLCIGVRKNSDKLDGHAWVEIEGRHFNDNLADTRFAVTFSHPNGIK